MKVNAESKGFDSHACGRLLARGRNAPPERCSVPLVLRIPFFYNTKRVKQLSLLYPLNLAESKGFDSRDCGRLVARGHNSPPDCCSVPLVLRIPFFYNTKRVKQLRYFTLLIWRRARDSTRTPAGVWSLAVATLHRSVALCRSSFESLSFGNIKRVKQLSLLYPLNLAESKGFEPSNR